MSRNRTRNKRRRAWRRYYENRVDGPLLRLVWAVLSEDQ